MPDKLVSWFHSTSDLRALADRSPAPAPAPAAALTDAHTLIPTFAPPNGFYQFDVHFHPYVDALVTRLLEHSVAGLQGADTEFTARYTDGSPDLSTPALFEDLF